MSTKYNIPKEKNTNDGSGSIVLEKKTLKGRATKKKLASNPPTVPRTFLPIRNRKTAEIREIKTVRFTKTHTDVLDEEIRRLQERINKL